MNDPDGRDGVQWAAFLGLLTFSLTPHAGPPVALAAGLLLGLVGLAPESAFVERASKHALKASIVLLGFGVPLGVVLDAGIRGLAYTSAAVLLAIPAGLLLGRLLRTPRDTSWLLTIGTAICGGSAIAALAPVIRARAASVAVALATVFLLNAVALYAFPPLGVRLGFDEAQFAAWAAIAIHDTASVVGAAATFGPQALDEATVLKLVRTLWIIPAVLVAAAYQARRDAPSAARRTAWPAFILLFALAALARHLVPAGLLWFDTAQSLGRLGLNAALFLIGASLRPVSLLNVGFRSLAQGVLLWVLVAGASAYAIPRHV